MNELTTSSVDKLKLKMSLGELLAGLCDVSAYAGLEISGVALHTDFVAPGYLFVALGNGINHLQTAQDRGATAVLCATAPDHPVNLPIIISPALSSQLGCIGAKFYGDPSQQLKVIGITGTNGKTSCSQLIAEGLAHHGMSCGVIGTVGYGFIHALTPSSLTTPDSLTLQRLMAEIRQANARAVTIEVSSHALIQQRVDKVKFDIGVFTNLSRDHLDYHHDMQAYAAAKRLLFSQPSMKQAVINADDPVGRAYINELKDKLSIFAYACNDIEIPDIPVIRAKAIKQSAGGLTAQVITPWGAGELQSRLLGKFNLSNLLAVITVQCLLGIDLADVLGRLHQLSGVLGRMQRFGHADQPTVIVDYAHTPDALENVLLTLREHCDGRLWCVFGCGGDRDAGKRPEMATVAQRYAHQIIVTDDNPRTESAERIVTDIMRGFTAQAPVTVIHDRAMAIQAAITQAAPNDIVLIAGKGHETYQIIGQEKLAFSDAEHVSRCLSAVSRAFVE